MTAPAEEQQVLPGTADSTSAVATHGSGGGGPPPPADRRDHERYRRPLKAPWVTGGLLVIAAAVISVVLTLTHDAPSPPVTRTVAVSATTGWQRTDVYLKVGEQFSVKYISGGWSVDYRNFPHVGPSGYSSQQDALIYQLCKYNTGSNYGVLFGAVGTGSRAFPIGEGGNFVAAAPARDVNGGYLYLRINDTCLTDNAGSVKLRISMP
jgi:hypothetical protein